MSQPSASSPNGHDPESSNSTDPQYDLFCSECRYQFSWKSNSPPSGNQLCGVCFSKKYHSSLTPIGIQRTKYGEPVWRVEDISHN